MRRKPLLPLILAALCLAAAYALAPANAQAQGSSSDAASSPTCPALPSE